MAALSPNSEKRKLENTSMNVYRVRGVQNITTLLLSADIPGFSKMKNNKVYTHINEQDWKISIIKKRRTATVMVHTRCDGIYDIDCTVHYSVNSKACPVKASRLSENEYIVELSSDILHNPNNELLRKEDLLKIGVSILLRTDIRVARPFVGASILKDLVSLDEIQQDISKDINEKPMIRFNSDIKICVQTHKIPAHKGFLAVRSKYFYNYLKENKEVKEIKLNTTPEALFSVIFFMYSGSLYVQELETMLRVLEMATRLEMNGLHDICLIYIKEQINRDTVHEIRESGSRKELKTIVSAADAFLANLSTKEADYKETLVKK